MPPSQKNAGIAYDVDADDRIVAVTSNWLSFARQNQAPDLTPEIVAGRSLFDFISDWQTRYCYRTLVDRVRSTQRASTIPFRCDSPTARRYMELTISPRDKGHLWFESRLLSEEERAAIPLLDPMADHSKGWILSCSWCKRINALGDWVEVEVAIRHLDLFSGGPLPRISHGVCDDCGKQLLREQKQGRPPGSTLGRAAGRRPPNKPTDTSN